MIKDMLYYRLTNKSFSAELKSSANLLFLEVKESLSFPLSSIFYCLLKIFQRSVFSALCISLFNMKSVGCTQKQCVVF